MLYAFNTNFFWTENITISVVFFNQILKSFFFCSPLCETGYYLLIITQFLFNVLYSISGTLYLDTSTNSAKLKPQRSVTFVLYRQRYVSKGSRKQMDEFSFTHFPMNGNRLNKVCWKMKSLLSVWLCNTKSFIVSGNRVALEVSFWAKWYFHWRNSGLNKGRNSLHTVSYFNLLHQRTTKNKAQERQVSEQNSSSKSHILRRLRQEFRTYRN
jgi:hypothetical protein